MPNDLKAYVQEHPAIVIGGLVAAGAGAYLLMRRGGKQPIDYLPFAAAGTGINLMGGYTGSAPGGSNSTIRPPYPGPGPGPGPNPEPVPPGYNDPNKYVPGRRLPPNPGYRTTEPPTMSDVYSPAMGRDPGSAPSVLTVERARLGMKAFY